MTRPSAFPPQFVLIGRGSLLRSCAQIVLDRGSPLAGLASPDPDVREWACAHGIECAARLEDLREPSGRAASVLLSLSNDRLIPAAQLARFATAVNFHDGPLPTYSGSHVTAWALMARERTYAITWHRMTMRADAGEILLQVPVPIAFDDTALTLNGKCHDAALASFPGLLAQIAEHQLAGHPQDLGRRCFYPRNRRPEREAVLDFRREADDLDALVRALDWGEFPNRLGVPKLWTGSDFVAARRLTVRAARSRLSPGTAAQITAETITVATATHDVTLSAFSTLDGEPLAAPDVAARLALRPGGALPGGGGALEAALNESARCSGAGEDAWVQRWRRLVPVVLPQRTDPQAPAHEALIDSTPTAPTGWLDRIGRWLGRVSGMEEFDVGLADTQAPGGLVTSARPLRLAAVSDMNARTEAELLAWQLDGPLLRDALLRHPGIRRPSGWRHFADWPVVVQFGHRTGEGAAPPLRVTIDASGAYCRVSSAPGAFSVAAFSRLISHLRAISTNRYPRQDA